MKRKVLTGVIIFVVVVVAILALKPLAKKEAAVTFDTVKVERGNISNTVTATGTIDAITTVDVGTQVSGIIQHVYVDFNQVVKQGQLLAKLDETSLLAQMDQSQASVDQAQAQLNYQEATYKRLKALYDKNLVAQSDYDQALYNYENSKASLINAKSAYTRAKVNLEYATITSPIDGVVLNRAVEEGQTVAASFNTPTLFTIVNDLTQMEVQTSVDEADIGKVKQGQRVEFTVDAYPDSKFEGSVSEVRLQPVTTNNVVTYVVILSAPNPDKKLMPGMTASATIFVEEKENTLILSGKALRFTPSSEYLTKMSPKLKSGNDVPNMPAGNKSAIDKMSDATGQVSTMSVTNSDPKIKKVWLKDEKTGLHSHTVNIGIENGSTVEILSGLNEGDNVIVSMDDGKNTVVTTRQSDVPRGPMPF
jgi:HlyD family secretion protein